MGFLFRIYAVTIKTQNIIKKKLFLTLCKTMIPNPIRSHRKIFRIKIHMKTYFILFFFDFIL